MDWSIFLLLSGLFTGVLLLLQRVDPKKRRIVLLTLAVPAIFTYNYISYRSAQAEAVIALVLAGAISLLFWLFIGRYNRPKSADETMQVLGLDD